MDICERDANGNPIPQDGEDSPTERYRVIGHIGAHVDDVLIAGQDDEPQWKHVLEQFQQAFTWTPWEPWI